MAEQDFAQVLTQLTARVKDLRDKAEDTRVVIAITGTPAAGKSTLADHLAERTGAIVVPMDGFHLAHAELERLNLAHVKGSLPSFDGGGFVSLLRRIVARDEDVVYAPEFRREIEEPIAGAIPVPREAPLVIIEGNYLLVDKEPWAQVRDLVTESWYLEADEEVVLERLVVRHTRFGRTAEQAREFALSNDMVNATVIAATAPRADAVIKYRL